MSASDSNKINSFEICPTLFLTRARAVALAALGEWSAFAVKIGLGRSDITEISNMRASGKPLTGIHPDRLATIVTMLRDQTSNYRTIIDSTSATDIERGTARNTLTKNNQTLTRLGRRLNAQRAQFVSWLDQVYALLERLNCQVGALKINRIGVLRQLHIGNGMRQWRFLIDDVKKLMEQSKLYQGSVPASAA